jgi:hypothetical protein
MTASQPPDFSSPPPFAQPYYRPTLIAAIAASAGVVIGSLGTWVHFMMFSVGGLDFASWGVVTLILGCISGAGLGANLYWTRISPTPQWASPLAWAAAVAGVACLTDAFINIGRIITVPKSNLFGVPIGVSVGWGLWLVGFSSAVLCVTASIVAVQIGKRPELDQPVSDFASPNGWRWAAIILSTVILIGGFIYAFTNPWSGNGGSGQGIGMPSFPNLFGDSKSATTSPTTTVKAGQAAQVGGLSFTVTRVVRKQSVGDTDSFLHFNADGIYEIVYYTVSNTGNQPESVDSMSQKLFINDREYRSDMMASQNADRRVRGSASLNPGFTADVLVVFDVPPGSPNGVLEVHTDSYSDNGVARIDLTSAPS